ncbi:NAD-binding protein [Streptomyces inhibens]|uniref:NAD-binding protein n=1 Tax=Streptomyces inhibens TaxID=2293571 RepID=UPI0036A203E9
MATSGNCRPGFPGHFRAGNEFSRPVLKAESIEEADAFVAVTSSDNTNIVSARTAEETYRVPSVMARIYDPRRADIYRELGIPTVASVRWTVSRIHQMLLHRELSPEFAFGNGETLLVRSPLPPYLNGRRLSEFDVGGEIRVVEVTRAGRSFVPMYSTPAEPDDLVTFAGGRDRPRSAAWLPEQGVGNMRALIAGAGRLGAQIAQVLAAPPQ